MFPAVAPAPLFGGIPGGPELLVILLLVLLFFGPVVLILGFLGVRYLGKDSKKRELERRVEELEAKVGEDDRDDADRRRRDTDTDRRRRDTDTDRRRRDTDDRN